MTIQKSSAPSNAISAPNTVRSIGLCAPILAPARSISYDVSPSRTRRSPFY